VDEAADYLRDPVLGARLVQATAVVRAHLGEGSRVRIDDLMGSHIDAMKLVSCMTLFAHVAKTLQRSHPQPLFTDMAGHADAILAAAAAQGYEHCRYTLGHVRARGPAGDG
jgi:uncharacterized protein (DUF1810 family)